MGSFYSTCSISNMTLSNQKTSIQLLVPGYTTDYKEHMNMIVSNDGAQCFFSPFGFPIHGVYDDYGYICNITTDKNTKMLEEYFGISIEEIIENVGDDRSIPKGIKNEEVFKMLGMTYFRTEVLEYVQSGWDSINYEKPEKYSSNERIAKLFKQLDAKPTGGMDRLLELSKRRDSLTEDELDELLDISDSLSSYKLRECTYISSLSKKKICLLSYL